MFRWLSILCLVVLILSTTVDLAWGVGNCELAEERVALAGRDRGAPPDIAKLMEQFIHATSAQHPGISFPEGDSGSDGAIKRLQFVIPDFGEGTGVTEQKNRVIQSFTDGLGKETVGLGAVVGWFEGQPGIRPPWHAYARVGGTVFHLNDDATVTIESYADLQRKIAANDKSMVSFENIYPVPAAQRRALRQFYLAIAEGKAQINGKPIKLQYGIDGRGKYDPDDPEKPIVLHCATYSLLFTQPEWQSAYPGIAGIAAGMGLPTMSVNGEISIASIPEAYRHSTAPMVMVLGKDFSNLKFPDDIPFSYLTTLRMAKPRPNKSIEEFRANARISSDNELWVPGNEGPVKHQPIWVPGSK